MGIWWEESEEYEKGGAEEENERERRRSLSMTFSSFGARLWGFLQPKIIDQHFWEAHSKNFHLKIDEKEPLLSKCRRQWREKIPISSLDLAFSGQKNEKCSFCRNGCLPEEEFRNVERYDAGSRKWNFLLSLTRLRRIWRKRGFYEVWEENFRLSFDWKNLNEIADNEMRFEAKCKRTAKNFTKK